MTKFIHKNEVVLETNHTSPHEIEIDEYDIDTSNWFFLKNNIKIYDRMEGVHQKDNVEFVLVENSKTDEKTRKNDKGRQEILKGGKHMYKVCRGLDEVGGC